MARKATTKTDARKRRNAPRKPSGEPTPPVVAAPPHDDVVCSEIGRHESPPPLPAPPKPKHHWHERASLPRNQDGEIVLSAVQEADRPASPGPGGLGIVCPRCGCAGPHRETAGWQVTKTELKDGSIRRRRECRNCGKSLFTVERPEVPADL